MSSLLVLALGIAVVIGLIVALRVHAFLALLAAALVVSAFAPGALAGKVARVGEAFGSTAGKIGIVIAMAAIIGRCMMDSGAADRIVRGLLRVLGAARGPTALTAGGFLLAVPVFFDTVFYLLVPLARSMHRKTGRHYLKYCMAIAAGGAITHALVPPTPGPLVIAQNLGVDLGTMILVGAAFAAPAAAVGLLYASWLDRRMPVPMRSIGDAPEPEPLDDDELPGLCWSLLPIVLPVLLISANTIASSVDGDGGSVARWTAVFGDPDLALGLAAVIAVLVLCRTRRPGRRELARTIESALMSGGVIILITAAGGAFGAMLQAAEVGAAIEAMFGGDGPRAYGAWILVLGFVVASLMKIAQGSGTVAMMTTSAMLAAMIDPADLAFHPVYLAVAIGGGSGVGSWMNDSGFWIFAKMSGLTEVETLKSWTPLLALLGFTSTILALVGALLLPMR